MPSGFTNSFTEGEIGDDAWDRVDIQPVGKGCEEGHNLIVRVAGPLGKRRGFWRNGDLVNPAVPGRMVPFRRSISDALMLEFGDGTVRVWAANGSPVMNGGAQVQFASPYAAADLPNLRWRQVVDVLYFHTSDGKRPHALQRDSDTAWAFNLVSYPNGPWLPENPIATGITMTPFGADITDANTDTGAGAILAGQAVTLNCSGGIFQPTHVGGWFRLRSTTSSVGVKSWTPGDAPPVGQFALSNGRAYVVKTDPGGTTKQNANTPPVQESGDQSDGHNLWSYLHDGAGVILVTGYVSPTQVTGTAIATIPLLNGQSTTYWSESAYSDFRGWPRAWPELVEERLAGGGTATSLDFLDMTGTADFDPTSETYSPGLGTGLVLDTDAIRRRTDDHAEIIWCVLSTFLIVGTTDGEHVASGGLFGSPITPSSIVVRQLSSYGSEDVYPAKAHKGLFFVCTGGQTIRERQMDLQQSDVSDDVTVLATHLVKPSEGVTRTFKQLAWVKQPDENLWTRLSDGTPAVLTSHQEQKVQGWTSPVLTGGWLVEDMQVIPGEGRFETLWMIVHRVKNGVDQRQIWMQSAVSDALFMDGAEFYQGAPATLIVGLPHFAGETVRILADGVQVPDQPVSAAGTVTLTTAASTVYVGLPYKVRFTSLKLATAMQDANGIINTRQRIAGAIVSVKTVKARAMIDGSKTGEKIQPPQSNLALPVPQRAIQQVNFTGDASRDPRVVIEEDTAYDFVLYSIKPAGAPNG